MKKSDTIHTIKLVVTCVFIIMSFCVCSCQIFYVSAKKDIIKGHSRRERELKKLNGTVLPFPFRCVWLKDSTFVERSEILIARWALDFGSRFDTTLLRAVDFPTIYKLNVDSLCLTKNREAYDHLLRHSLLASGFVVRKMERPLVFVDSLAIFNYIQFLNTEINSYFENREEHWFWNKFSDKELQVRYSLLTFDDYLLALKKYQNWTPSLEITDEMTSEPSVPVQLSENHHYDDKILGLVDNASEVILYNDKLYVVYNVQKDRISITRFISPDFHIGFRLKCSVIKKIA